MSSARSSPSRTGSHLIHEKSSPIGASFMFDPSEPSAFQDLPPNVSLHWENAVRNAGRGNISTCLIDPRGRLPIASSAELAVPNGSTDYQQRGSFIRQGERRGLEGPCPSHARLMDAK